MRTVVILGASADRSKYGNKAVRAFQQQGYAVYPVNPKEAEIEGLLAEAGKVLVPKFLEHYAAIVWEDQDECLEVRPEDVEL